MTAGTTLLVVTTVGAMAETLKIKALAVKVEEEEEEEDREQKESKDDIIIREESAQKVAKLQTSACFSYLAFGFRL